ncbi:hypothetical protein JD844_013348 [Phrynosoma platyrhinos]|uniref:Zinc finger protein RFP-like n=1 Tax=Phrynosoma platyrhinos TaxID=52577 RepID=A0ABQ7TL32_PHRPL|nr:hypothetical protein JD844_013348 [Phrynosoma platyrhinos]
MAPSLSLSANGVPVGSQAEEEEAEASPRPSFPSSFPAMASSESPLETLQREITCSICLSYFREPVSIDCGHNFCQACIAQCWGRSEDENTSCPQCRRWSRKRSFRPNRELGNVVEVAKRLRLEAASSLAAGQRLCQKHQEPLKLFCEQDEAPVCVICRESRAHKAHPMLPIEEAAQDYKKQVATHVKALKERREKLKESKEDLECRSQADQDDVQTEKQKVEVEFNQIHEFLEKIERFLIIMLKKFDKEIVQKRDGVATRLSEEIDRLDALITEVEEKCQQPACEFLQMLTCKMSCLRIFHCRCKDGQLPRLVEISSSPTELEKKLGHFSLKNIVIKEALDKCRETMISELAKARSMETSAKMVSITLDPKSAHPLLVVSECKKSVRRGEMVQPLPNNPERFDATLILLGCERFASGIHYWEVEVGDGQNWALGVAKESIKRKGPVVTCPDEGIWALGLCGDEYKAFTSSDTRLTLDEAPEKIQIFVHYERGWVAFFDADYMSLIFIFRSANFGGEKICPFFKVWGLSTVLKMLP